jgi:aconitate decarboxylase
MAPQAVVVYLKGGTALNWDRTTMLANPARQLTREQHLSKFHRCCTFSLDELAPGPPERVVEAADRLEEIEDVQVLIGLVSSASESMSRRGSRS